MSGSSFSLAELETGKYGQDRAHAVVFDEEKIRDIAIVGMSCKFPKAENQHEFWENLKNGRDCIGDLPDGRKKDVMDFMDFKGLRAPKFSKGAYLDEIDKFDCGLFRLSPREAALMNPTQRLFLETAWETIEDAGYSAGSLAGSNTGVYVGYIGDLEGYKYRQMISEVCSGENAVALPGNLSSIIPGRISYMLDLKGPAMLVDTACSSSLVAVHLACNAIRNGDCDMAIAGGVRINIFPVETDEKIGIESSDGRTHSFDDNSDGTGLGEGVAAVMLKPLESAVRNRDHIYAVIKGTAINQDGSSAGITAPNAAAQADVIIKAWKDADVDPEAISYIEAHGTGTRLGDPVEIEGISEAFAGYTHRKQFCAIGSVKSNIGHLYDSAGIVSLIKTVLMLKNKMLIPSINFKKPNSGINFEDSPVYVNTKLRPWETGTGALLCGVSSFGFSGTNCHLVMQEAPSGTESSRETQESPELLVLSAKTGALLAELAGRYCDFLGADNCAELRGIAFTANTGRNNYDYRAALVVHSIEDLKYKMQKLAEGGESCGLYCNNGEAACGGKKAGLNAAAQEKTAEFISTGRKNAKLLEELGGLFIAGAEINWKAFYKNKRRKKTSIPLTPFEKKRCWIKIPEKAGPVSQMQPQPVREAGLDSGAGAVITGRDSGVYSDTERAIAGVWAKELGYDEIGINNSFQQMGGDSILAAKTANSLGSLLKKPVSAADILKYETIYSLAENLDSRAGTGDESVATAKLDANGYYRLSSAQKRLYILHQLQPAGLQYNLPYSIEVEGSIDRTRLREVFESLIKRHESFRTSFHMTDGEPAQKIHAEADFELQFFDEAETGPEEVIKNFIRPFDLAKAPLFRAGVIKQADGKQIILVDMHHIISDGTSMAVLLGDFASLYGQKKLQEMKVHYRDYAVFQHSRRTSPRTAEQEKYWREVFRDEAQELNLLPDFTATEGNLDRAGAVSFQLESTLSGSLRELAAKHGCTMYMVLLAAYCIMLSKYSGSEDITVGTPTAGRMRKEFEDIIGMFVNTVAMRNFPACSRDFRDFLLSVRENTQNAFANQDFQFDDLIAGLGINRDAGSNPLFNTMFVMQNMRFPDINTGGLKFGKIKPESRSIAFDLVMEVFEGESMSGSLQYRSGKFRESTMARMAAHYKNILREVALNPDAKIADIKMMSHEEEQEILEVFNNTAAKYPETKTAHELFEEQVKRTPNKTALVFEGKTLTYDELNRKSNQLARLLREKGVKPGTIAAIMAGQSLEMIIAIMAILKAGGAYLPIDPKYPEDRIKYMLKDSAAALLLTQEKLIKQFVGINSISIDCKEIYSGQNSCLKKVCKPSDLAYVIYTSGSTGDPKGVLVEHKSLVNLVDWHLKQYAVSMADNATKYAGFGFDASVWEIFPYLLAGATLHIISDDIKLDVNRLGAYYDENRITISFLPTHVCEQFLQYESKSLTRLLTGGDKIQRVRKTKYELFNNYGPTENTVVSTAYRVCEFSQNIPIGKPIQNTKIVITGLNNKGLQPVGVPGELCVSGAGLARGYLNKPELTSEKFIESIFYNGERMYKTGVLARWLPDGNIEFLGRIDSQVKIRGIRIELGEIKNCLLRQDVVKEAVVIDREDAVGGKYLCAYIVTQKEVDINLLKAKLAAILPDYMVPAFICRVSGIPLNPNGKIDKKALPEPSLHMYSDNKYIRPETEVELDIVQVWEDMLGLEKIGVNDNFFEIGGNSLKALQVVSKLSGSYEITTGDLFKHQTIRSLAEMISGKNNSLRRRIEDAKKLLGSCDNNIIPDQLFSQAIEEYRETINLYTDINMTGKIEYRGILLTGGTGYLGMHVLKETLQKTNSFIYLIVRGANRENALERVVNKLDFYFKNENIYEIYKNRINIQNGDITCDRFGLAAAEYLDLVDNVDCIINCAANVRHYGKDRDFYGVNVSVVEKLVELARTGVKKDLHHISTMSVGSGYVKGKKHLLFSENDCDMGQISDNIYISSKLEAEKIVFSAREKGVRANIYRVGNLVFDSVRGRFQENIEENGFYNIIKSFICLGMIPDYSGWKMEFSFIDRVSKAIVLLMQAEKMENEVFHIYNNKLMAPGEFSLIMRSNGYEIDEIGISDFLDLINIYKNKPDYSQHVEKFLIHSRILDNLDETRFYPISEKTNLLLGKLGFSWEEVTRLHIKKMCGYCEEIGFFEKRQL